MDTTILEDYIQRGDTQALSTLLNQYPVLVKTTTSYSVSPLMLACYHKKPAIVSIILTHLNTLTLFEAAAIGNIQAVNYLLENHPQLVNHYSPDGFTALGLACFFGQADIANTLIAKGADVQLPSTNAFHVYPIHSAVAANDIAILRLLTDYGANVNVKQQMGITPLHGAAANGNLEMIILLLENGALVNIAAHNGQLPADVAREKGFNEVAAILSA